MTIRPRGRAFIVDVKVAAAHNPSREDRRVRVSAKDYDEAIRLEAMVRYELQRTGNWTGVDSLAQTGKPKRGAGTLKAALQLAWDDAFEGWGLPTARTGLLQYRNAKACIDILGEETLCASVTREDYQRVALVLREKANSSDTITRKLQALHRVLHFAVQARWIKARPHWKRPTPGQPREFTFSPDLEADVVGYFSGVLGLPDLADLFTLGIDTGARLGELLALDAQDIDLANRFARVRGKDDGRGGRSTKNGDVRTVILVDRAMETLRRRLEATGRTGKLFPGWDASKVARRMVQAREALGHEHNPAFTFHATRHTCGTRMAQDGVELFTMMDQLGHRTPSITRRYVNMSPDARRTAILRSRGQLTEAHAN